MEITKCSDISKTTYQYFNQDYSKSFHSQSVSFFVVVAIKLQK
jgi:hypothetical protein